MFFVIALFTSFCFMTLNHINADYILSFNPSDLCFLKNMVTWSSIADKKCANECDVKRKVIERFIKYGNKKGFTANTQFAKGYMIHVGENPFHEIRFDPTLFDLSSDTSLTITIFKDFSFILSPKLNTLIEKFFMHPGNTKL